MAKIGPHGDCPVCIDNDSARGPRCRCHGTGCACPGGTVRGYIPLDKLTRWHLGGEDGFHVGEAFLKFGDGIYICQSCMSVVPTEAVQHV